MTLTQIIYSSTPFGYDNAVLAGILVDARRNNTRHGITGALICRADVFLQLLEGPQDKVEAAFERIKQDDRHLEVTLHLNSPIAARSFGKWAMLDDPARSWLWTQDEVAEGAITRATPLAMTAVFARLASVHNAA